MNEHLQELKRGGRPMTKLELANKEIARLNNIINELEEYLIEQVEKSYSNDYDNVLDKLDKLKGSDKE